MASCSKTIVNLWKKSIMEADKGEFYASNYLTNTKK